MSTMLRKHLAALEFNRLRAKGWSPSKVHYKYMHLARARGPKQAALYRTIAERAASEM